MPTDGAQQTGWSVPNERSSERAECGRESQLSIDSSKMQRAPDQNSRSRESEKTLRNARAELARASHLTVMASLAASIAHEINQPLTNVVSNAAAAIQWLS